VGAAKSYKTVPDEQEAIMVGEVTDSDAGEACSACKFKGPQPGRTSGDDFSARSRSLAPRCRRPKRAAVGYGERTLGCRRVTRT